MKRWVSGAMAFILSFSCAQGGLALASGDAEEVIVEALMEEEAPAEFEQMPDEIVVEAEPIGVEPDSEAVPAEHEETLGEDTEDDGDNGLELDIETAPASVARYARIASETAEIRETPEGAEIAWLSAGSAVLLVKEDAEWIDVAFNTERGIVTGCVKAEALALLNDEDTAAYLNALAESEAIAAYEGDINRPLELLDCAFADDEAEPEAEEAEATETEEEGQPEDATEPETEEEPSEEGETAEAEPESVVERQPEAAALAEAQTTEAASQESAQAASGESMAATQIAMQVNKSQLTLGLKEIYTGLSVTGASGVTWSSSNDKIVKVDASSGAVKGLKKGTATVTATSGSGQTAEVSVTVKAAPKKIAFSSKKLTIGGADKSVTLTVKLSKNSASAGTTFTSSNESVATVDASGVVTAHSTGTATITAKTFNKKKATCKVTVYAEPMPAAIKLPSKLTIGAKETRAALDVQLTPAEGESQCSTAVVWSSSNKKIVKVNAKTGAIKGVKKGTATIVAKTPNGLKAKCKVTVKKAPKKVALKPASSTVSIGGTVQFSVSVPKGSASGYTFASSNTSVATIDQNGLATGVGAGKTTITVTTYNGKKASATLEVTAASSTDTSTKSAVNVPSSMEKLGIASYQNVYSANMSSEQKLEYVIYCAQTQLGKPYVYGGGYEGANPSGFDCSGLVYWSFKQAGVKLQASAYKQGSDSKYTKISDISSLKRGDVMCFYTGSGTSGDVNHTGIYLGNGYFIHASSGSSKRKVVVQRLTGDSISSDFYKRHFKWGRRIMN